MKRSAWVVWSSLLFVLACGVAQADVRYTSRALRDPFTDPASANALNDDALDIEARIKAMRLQGLLYSGDNPQAIIWNKIYSVGDKVVGPVKIARIEKDHVVLDFNGKEYTLKQTIGKKTNDTESPNADTQSK